jgi:threonine synthase
VSAGYKVSLAESWHNPVGTHAYLVQKLYNLVIGEKNNTKLPNSWFRTVVNIALLFGVYGKYSRQEIYEFDIAVQTGDLLPLLAIRYAQKMGLPVRKIILGSLEGDGLWEFLSYGNYQATHKDILAGFESLLWLEFGYNEAENYVHAITSKRTYRLKEWKLDYFRKDLFTTVVGDNRVKNVIDSTFRTNNYRMEESTARAFAALQDYRAKTGVNKNTLLFSRNAPAK